MKRTTCEKKVNEIKEIIRVSNININETAKLCCYLAGYIPEAPIGDCLEAIFSLRRENE